MPRKINSVDPTGQAKTRNRASRALISRLNKAKVDITVNIFNMIPRRTKISQKVVNVLVENELIYIYDLTAQELLLLAQQISNSLNIHLEVSDLMMPNGWFFAEFIELPYRRATLEDVQDINRLVIEATNAGLIEPSPFTQELNSFQVVNSSTYRKNLQKEFAKNFELVKTLSNKTSSQVFTEIRAGIEAGENPTTIRRRITKRFDVSKSDAERIARTEVNAAYNNAKLEMTDIASDQLDLNIGNIHISALTATTRQTHAARHGLAYSTSDQLKWWNTTPNRINCLCSTQKMVLDENNEVINKELQDEIRQDGKDFFGK